MVLTDARGRVVYMHGKLLRMMKIANAAMIMGEPLRAVLGIDDDLARQLVEEVARNGPAHGLALELRASALHPISVVGTSVATYNDRGDFIGADITFYDPATAERIDARPLDHSDTLSAQIQHVQTEAQPPQEEDEMDLLRLYMTVQFRALHVLLARAGGLRVCATLEATLNKLAAKQGWPVSVQGSDVAMEQTDAQAEIMCALLGETARYIANVIGQRMVIAEMNAVDDQLDDRTIQVAEQAGLLDHSGAC
jgi:hypothetical protein